MRETCDPWQVDVPLQMQGRAAQFLALSGPKKGNSHVLKPAALPSVYPQRRVFDAA